MVGEVYLLLKKKKISQGFLASLGNKIVLVATSEHGIISSSPRFLPAAGASVLLHRDASVRRGRGGLGHRVSPELPAVPALALLALGCGIKRVNVGLVQNGHF